MPKPKTPTDPEAEHVARMLAALAEFENGFRRSKRGNLWRIYDGQTVTIFQHTDTTFAWCINDGEETRFSKRRFDSEADAMADLAEAVGVGW